MSAHELDEDVTLSPYDPAWPGAASQLARAVAELLHGLGAQIEHVGSTAVPGLAAKPIIDLLAGLPGGVGVEEAASRLVGDGWQDLGEAGVAGRRYLRYRGANAANLHLVSLGREHWTNNLLLRDYLRSHPSEAAEYAAAKGDALQAGHTRLLAYSAAKADVIAALLSKAKAWSRDRGADL